MNDPYQNFMVKTVKILVKINKISSCIIVLTNIIDIKAPFAERFRQNVNGR